ncbi:MAG: TrkH family potassium uptake protein [Lutispora sp.]|nr:TrkH family potassium uptake protein [Lutispora sp.]
MKLSFLKRSFNASPSQILVIGFGTIILLGTILLNMPIASIKGHSIGFVNALFTATSAVCVTGLVVVDTANHWTYFGQMVIISLIQIGGLGFMTISTLLALIVGRRITLKERIVMQEALNLDELEGLVRLTKSIIITTFIIEAIGAMAFSAVFVPEYGVKKGLVMGLFHSISAFCNAGFDLIGDFKSFSPYVNNITINVTTMLLIIIGGLGFTVWMDVYHNRSFNRLALHSKVVLSITGFLISAGALFLFMIERNNPATMGDLPISGKILSSMFHSVSPRTAGFNTIDNAAFTSSSKFLTIILMFIGGSPGSTAGGIKTATAGILFFTVISVITGREDAEAFEKRISKTLVYRAFALAIISLFLVISVTMVLSISENADFLTLLFESTSAFATVGLSLNYSPNLSFIGKLIIAVTMFAGRVGPLTLVVALAQRAQKNKSNLKYPEDKILVG